MKKLCESLCLLCASLCHSFLFSLSSPPGDRTPVRIPNLVGGASPGPPVSGPNPPGIGMSGLPGLVILMSLFRQPQILFEDRIK